MNNMAPIMERFFMNWIILLPTAAMKKIVQSSKRPKTVSGPRITWNMVFSLCQVKQQNFGWTSSTNRHRVLVRDGSAITSGEIVSEKIDSSF